MGERNITEFDLRTENRTLEYDWKLFELEKQLNILRYVNPLNTWEEKRKFMKSFAAGKRYNPVFKYERLGPEVNGYLRDLEKMRSKLEKCRPSLFAPYCIEKIDSLLYLLELLKEREREGRGRKEEREGKEGRNWKKVKEWVFSGPGFGEKMAAFYGKPRKELLKAARRNLNELKEIEETETLGAPEMRKIFEEEIRRYGLEWEVRPAGGGGAKLAVNAARREIYIDSFARFSENSIKRYLCHEIGTHVFRAENGKNQPFRLFLSGFQGYGETEEGLAVYNEQRSGLLDRVTLKKYSARVVAAALCTETSFSELFEELLPYYPPEKAFTFVQRVKRGLTDTSLPGGYPKDFVYLSGYQKVSSFLQNQASESEALKVLYCGKIGLENFDLARDLLEQGVLKPPRFLPDFEKEIPAPPR